MINQTKQNFILRIFITTIVAIPSIYAWVIVWDFFRKIPEEGIFFWSLFIIAIAPAIVVNIVCKDKSYLWKWLCSTVLFVIGAMLLFLFIIPPSVNGANGGLLSVILTFVTPLPIGLVCIIAEVIKQIKQGNSSEDLEV